MRKTLLFVLLILYITAFSQSNDSRFILIRGESKKAVDPDKIVLTIVFAETEHIKKQSDINNYEDELKKLLRSFSIDQKNLSIDNFSASRYEYYKTSSTKISMTRAFKLQVKQVNLIDSLMLKLFKIGATNVSVTNLHSNKLESLKIEASLQALDNAKSKAELMAAHMGLSLGDVMEINEYNPQYQPLIYDNYSNNKLNMRSGGSISQSEGDIGIRKIVVKYTVDVKFELK